MESQPVLFGRDSERQALRAVVAGAAGGQPGLLLLHGEAGIGKTSLVREAAGEARGDGAHVLFGQCLRFGADVTSYVPFSQALTHWLRTASPRARERLAPHGGLEELVPALSDPSHGVALLQIGKVLDAFAADGPTVLVLDDLQWCDPSSLDALAYVVAGFVDGQRLAILATYRDTGLAEGHRLHGWLADALRMSSVAQLELGRLDAWSVEEMVVARGGPALPPVMAAEVLQRSGGNPYLADLLIGEATSVGGDHVPSGARLVDALTASWHGLPAPARQVTQLLAVAGAPVAFPVLRDLAAMRSVASQDLARALAAASAQGITTETESGAIWFRHPLLAEAIAGTMSGWERAELHREAAAVWLAAVDVDDRDRANFLALHYAAAGNSEEGFIWSVRAADEAGSIRAADEEASHLTTAVGMLEHLPGDVADQVDQVALLCRAARAAERVGDDHAAVAHYEVALSRLDRTGQDLLLACRILFELHILRNIATDGSRHLSQSEPQEVIDRTEGLPVSQERATAFARLAYAEVFNGVEQAGEHAATAVRLAEVVDTADARIWALGVRSQTRWGTVEGVDDAEKAFAIASTHDDPQLLAHAAVFLYNCYLSVGRYVDAAAVTGNAYRSLRDAGEFQAAARVGGASARLEFLLGRWQQVRPMVRELLTIARSEPTAASARCVAALLSAHEGNSAAALMHLRRAEELMPHAIPIGEPLVDTQIRVRLALGQPLEALDVIEQHMPAAVLVGPDEADEWLRCASDAAYQLAEGAVSSDRRHEALRRLELIEATRGTEPPPFAPAGPGDVVHPALGAVHAAQRASCAGELASLDELWETACAATARADLRYDHARALYRLGRHLLTARQGRRRATAALVRSRGIAVDLGAGSLVRDIDDLAAQTHLVVSTEGPDQLSTSSAPHTVPGEATMTSREREVLGGLLAGETYAQIGTRLFVSEKTVSSHVSHILRKSGATSRIELAAMARRHDVTPGS